MHRISSCDLQYQWNQIVKVFDVSVTMKNYNIKMKNLKVRYYKKFLGSFENTICNGSVV